jgi:hypothetical protein
MRYKLKFTQTVDTKTTKYKVYPITRESDSCYYFLDNNGNSCSIYKQLCCGEYAVLISRISSNIKIL